MLDRLGNMKMSSPVKKLSSYSVKHKDRMGKVGSERGQVRVCHHLTIPQEKIIDQNEKMIKAMKSRMA